MGWDGLGRKGSGEVGMLDRGSRGFEWWEERLRNAGHWEFTLNKGLPSK